jgi:hypothetical protein
MDRPRPGAASVTIKCAMGKCPMGKCATGGPIRRQPASRAAFDQGARSHLFRLGYDMPRGRPPPTAAPRNPDTAGSVRGRSRRRSRPAYPEISPPAGLRPAPHRAPAYRCAGSSICRRLHLILPDPIHRHDARRAACKHDQAVTGMSTLSPLITSPVMLTLGIAACVLSAPCRCLGEAAVSAARRAWSAGNRGTPRRAWNCAAPPDRRRTPRPSDPSARAARAPGR